MRLRHSSSARLTHVAKIGDSPLPERSALKRLLAIGAMTAVILVVFFGGRHWVGTMLAEHWRKSLETVSDDQAAGLVASAARLGRPGLPVLVAALGSPRESVSSAGRLWLDRELESWENLSNREAQRNVAALAEALASQLDSLDPAAKLEASRLASRLLRWNLDGETVDRGRVIWLCDRVLHATEYVASRSKSHAVKTSSEGSKTPLPNESPDEPESLSTIAQRLSIPELPQEDYVRGRFASQPAPVAAPNVISLPGVAPEASSTDLAEAWAMRGRRLETLPQGSEVKIYPSTDQKVLVPPASEEPPSSITRSFRDMSLAECISRLHDTGFASLAAESELKRRGFDDLRLSIARRVHDPDRQVRLKLVRDLPEIPSAGATDWLLMMARDEDDEVRLAAISLLATASDPGILAEVESLARNDPAERIREQAARLAKRRQTLRR